MLTWTLKEHWRIIMSRQKTVMAWIARDKKGPLKKRNYLYRLKPTKGTGLVDGEWQERAGENWAVELPNIDIKPGELRRVKITLQPVEIS